MAEFCETEREKSASKSWTGSVTVCDPSVATSVKVTVSPGTAERFPNVRIEVPGAGTLDGLNKHVTVEFPVQLNCAFPAGGFAPPHALIFTK